MLPIVNGEGPYRASTGGVGAVVGPGITDPMDTFKESYSIATRIKADMLAEQERKRKAIQVALGDIDFSTKGIRPSDAAYFQKGKNAISSFYQHALSQNVNPDNPGFLKDNARAQAIKRSYSVMVDSSVALNNQIKEAAAALHKDPSKYDWEKSVQNIREFANKPLVQAVNEPKDLLVPKGWNLEKWASGLFDEKKGEYHPETSVTTDKSGKVIETTGFSEWDPNMKSFPKTQEIASWSIRNNPDFRDYVMGEYDQLPPAVKKEYNAIAQTATKNGNPISAEDYYAYTLLEPYAWTKKNYKGETAYTKAAAKSAAGAGQIKRTFQSDIDRFLLFARGDNSIYQMRDGGKVSQYFVGKKVGTYINDLGEEKPSYLIEAKHMGQTAEGRPIIKYKTTGTVAQAGEGMVDADGYVTTNDPNDIIYPMINSEYGKDAQQYIKAYQDRVKELKAWKGGTVDPYTPEIDKLSPNYKLEDVQKQADAIDELNPDSYNSSSGNRIVKDLFKSGGFFPTDPKRLFPWQKK